MAESFEVYVGRVPVSGHHSGATERAYAAAKGFEPIVESIRGTLMDSKHKLEGFKL